MMPLRFRPALALLITPLALANAQDSARVPATRSVEALAAMRVDSSHRDSTIKDLLLIERAFLSWWFRSWTSYPEARQPRMPQSTYDSLYEARGWAAQISRAAIPLPAVLHCHVDRVPVARTAPTSRSDVFARLDDHIIEAGVGRHAVCPTWTRDPETVNGDERLHLDTGMTAVERERVRAERAVLLGHLARAAGWFPSDAWIVGQRVRFLVDQRDTAAVVSVIDNCRSEAWWCGLLAGYVTHWRGQSQRAESLFMRALARAPADVRCQLDDVGMLFPEEARKSLGGIPCELREDLNARIWWLADPLYREPGNSRRAEHYARAVLAVLSASPPEAGRYEWSNNFGGAAIREMIRRYGWPSLARWEGDGLGVSHRSYLRAVRPMNFTTSEYDLDRIHTIPAWEAVLRPHEASERSWQLTARAAFQEKTKNFRENSWWPEEHAPRDRGPLMQRFAEQQIVQLRRDDSVMVAIAADLPAKELETMTGRPVAGSYFAMRSPDEFVRVDVQDTTGGSTWGKLTVRPWWHLLALEFEVDRGPDAKPVASRTRFAITPPPSLSRLAPGEIALSDIAIVRPEVLDGPTSADRILPAMLPSLTLTSPERFGLYWESYGVSPSDSVEVSVTVERLNAAGFINRVVSSLGLATRTEERVTIRWTEPRPADRVAIIPARVPVIARSLPINASNLKPGQYRLSVEITAKGRTASATRELIIQ